MVVQWLRLSASNEEGHGFDPWSGNEDPTYCTAKKKKKDKNKQAKKGNEKNWTGEKMSQAHITEHMPSDCS